MLGALIIVFREAIEAGLIIGIVLAVTRGVAGSRGFVAAGVGIGALGAIVVAAFADRLSQAFAGSGQELFNASILAIAVVMLVWHNIWMAQHGRELAQNLSDVGRAVARGDETLFALTAVVGLAVLREGAEVALFLYGILASGESGWDVFAGGLAGLALGAVTSVATFYGLVAIPPRRLFAVTTWLITLLAAGLAAQCVAFLQQAGAAHADRLRRPAFRHAGRGLSRDAHRHRRGDQVFCRAAAFGHGARPGGVASGRLRARRSTAASAAAEEILEYASIRRPAPLPRPF
ncbi:MAG: iron permease FTR1, partial [Methylocystaceae bacterium]